MNDYKEQLKRQIEMSKHADEDYVKHIFQIRLQKGIVRIRDLSEAIGRSDSSVRAAVSKLTERGYVKENEGRGGNVELTQEGRELAEKVLARHNMIQDWMIKLGISPEEAEQQACQMEHVISDSVLSAIRKHVDLAMSLLGSDSAYPEKMRRMAEGMRSGRLEAISSKAVPQRMNLVQDDEIVSLLEKFGGMEQIRRTLDFCKAQGGIEALQEMTSFIEIVGGIEEVREARSQIAQKRSESRLSDAVRLISEEGGVETLRQAARQIDSLGGQVKIRKLLRFAEEVGGMENLLELSERALSLKKVFEKIGDTAEND